MFKQIGKDDVSLTRDFVDYFSSLPTFKGDRKRDTPQGRRRIAFLERMLREGKFFDCDWATAEMNGVTYRVNGGHSSLMLSQLSGNFPNGLRTTIKRFKCESRDDLADLFDQFDRRESIRTTNEKISAHKGAHDSLDELSTTVINDCLQGIAWRIRDDGKQPPLNEDEKIGLVHENSEFFLWAKKYVGRRHLKFTGAVAAMYECYHRDMLLASQFWDLVMEESHPSNADGSRVIAVFLRSCMSKPGTKSMKTPTRMIYAKCIHAANAWKGNYSTDLKYHEAAPLPTLKW